MKTLEPRQWFQCIGTDGKGTESLASLRHSTLTKKIVSSTSFVTPERLPPTASSTKLHSPRVYYQMMVWIGKESDIDVLNWGWKLEDNQLIPVMSDMNAAPDKLLKMIHCKCKIACRTPRCSCRVYGLPCTPACGQCQLETCDNPYNQATFIEEEGEERQECN